ncbi:hypothetical protein MH1LPH_19900 [Lactiplantibacillus brownii]
MIPCACGISSLVTKTFVKGDIKAEEKLPSKSAMKLKHAIKKIKIRVIELRHNQAIIKNTIDLVTEF